MDQPYTCTQWGHAFTTYIPPIIDDGIENIVRGWFEVKPGGGVGGYPLTVFINSNMEIYKIHAGSTGMTFTAINEIIEEMLDN